MFFFRCEENNVTVKASLLNHRVASFGFVVAEDPIPGKSVIFICVFIVDLCFIFNKTACR